MSARHFGGKNVTPSLFCKNVVVSKIVKNTVAVLAFFDQQKGSVTSNNNNGATYTANNEKGQVFKTTGLQFDNWLFGPEKFSGLSRNRPQLCRTERANDLHTSAMTYTSFRHRTA